MVIDDGLAPGGSPPMDELIEVLLRTHGLDVSRHDESFLAASVGKRRQTASCATLAAYVDRLSHDRGEAEALLESLENHHSELFRDPLAFALLEGTILPGLAAESEAAGRSGLRVWSAGCAAGQEAYSLAILLAELSDARARPVPFWLFATDISPAELSLARAGAYDAATMRHVRLGHLTRWFTRRGAAYVASAGLREQVDFSVHDLFDGRSTSPPESIFGEFDLVACCNVLLYYRPEGRQLILDKLRRCLAPGGYLVTGSTERDAVQSAGGFRAVAPPAAVFQRER